MEYLKGLNEAQKQAVLHADGPLLIVAGAGAGKTKTITHRIAHLAASGVPARRILAVTFTNKAAGEMRERALALLPGALDWREQPLVATFHALGVRILREFAEEAGLARSFVIWDRDDSQRAVKRALAELGIEAYAPRQVLGRISREKGEGASARDFTGSTPFERAVGSAWEKYERALAAENALDFDDLLARTLTLLKENEQVRGRLQDRWQYVTIDEYQDTNRLQYEIAALLAGERKNICAVGDTDQCLVAGTLVSLPDGTAKPIECLKAGDAVLSAHGSGDMRPARVMRARSRTYRGELIRITTERGRTLTSTLEHMHFAGYRLGIVPQMHFTYLMHKQGHGWRLGVSQVYTKGQRMPMVGFVQRTNHEHADALWILASHDTSQAARVFEYTLSLQHGIPTIPFTARKGASSNGYVHDQATIDAIFRSLDTDAPARKLLSAYGLSPERPHHRPQSRNSNRRNVVITLCGERRATKPVHRVSMVGNDEEGRRKLQEAGFSIRSARHGSQSWRMETCYAEYETAIAAAERIRALLPETIITRVARLGGWKQNPKDGNSLPFTEASAVRPGMAIFDEECRYDIVKSVERIETGKATRVYDLDIEHTHNFVANGVATHNCIYSWRGADTAHLLSFEAAFPNTKVVTLEQNYRSTQTILAAANAVIEKNLRRKPKRLFSELGTGESIRFYQALDESDEARFVARTARELIASGMLASEIAVLYRENFQSRAIEEALIALGIPYRIAGVRFFERKEVKDVLSYARAALNPKSAVDLSRIVSAPPRGIGKQTLEKMLAGREGELAAAARAKVAAFRALLEDMRRVIEEKPASAAFAHIFAASGLEKAFSLDREEGEERTDNVRELIALASRYDSLAPQEGVERVLEEAALMADQDSLAEKSEAVSLMTVHASKGLEFDAVFVTGLEQGLFPSERGDTASSGERARDPEEERRLFYVALTRARSLLFLSSASARARYGTREFALPSEFLDDIDPRLVAPEEAPAPRRGMRRGGGILDSYEDEIR